MAAAEMQDDRIACGEVPTIVCALAGQNQCNHKARVQSIVAVHRVITIEIRSSFSSPISTRIGAAGALESACYPAAILSSFEQERGS